MKYPELSAPDAWALALGVTPVLYLSIAAHELAHSLVSRRLGIPVRSITLFLFGGLANMVREPRRARDELLIAAAGPLMNVLLALGFLAPGWAMRGQIETSWAAFSAWLEGANLSLALFNLIPGFPLDGGQILRALLWGWTGKLERATQIAAGIGQWIAYTLMGAELLQTRAGDLVQGLWILLIGWFLQGAAAQAVTAIRMKTGLAGLTVAQLTRQDRPFAPPTLTLTEFLDDYAIPSGLDWFPVSFGSRAIGVISVEEVRSVDLARWEITTVGTVMKPLGELPMIPPEVGAYEALERMLAGNFSWLHVLKAGEWLGAISRDGILASWRLRTGLKAA